MNIPSLSEFLGRKTPRQLQRIIRWEIFWIHNVCEEYPWNNEPWLYCSNQRQNNEKMFNVFIEFPKPIIAAVNGPGIGENLRLLWSLQNICTILLVTFTQEQIYMSGIDEHKNQGLVQQPQHCATLFLPLLAPLSSHLLPGENIILILIAPLWWFLKVMTKFTSSWSWSCYLFAYGSGDQWR